MIQLGFLLFGLRAQAESTPSELIKSAQQREMAYLLSEKAALQAQLESQSKQNANQVRLLEQDIVNVERLLVQLNGETELKAEQLLELERSQENQSDGLMALQGIVAQVQDQPVGDALSGTELLETLDSIFQAQIQDLESAQANQTSTQQVFNLKGESIEAEVEYYGNIAAFAQYEGQRIALRPLGEKALGFVDSWGTSDAALSQFFLFEGTKKRIDEAKEKSVQDTLEAGGTVAYVIAAIGVFGLCLAGLRAFILQRAGRERYEQAAQELHDSQKLTVACRPIQQLMDSQSDSHDTLMDLAETIVLQEKSRLERFGTAILVIAAVAPLLGLLGTVTGMIGTFEMITEHGTGDPKMLSGGISEALITTQLGLVVAIPMVLLGNALNTWSSRILSRLEAGILLAVATRSEERIEHAS